MTFLERARALEQRASRKRQHEERENIARTVRDRTSNLEKLVTRLDSIRARMQALRELEYQVSSWPLPPLGAFQAYEAQNVSWKSTDEGRSAWEKFVRSFDKYVAAAEKIVREDIERVRTAMLDGVSSRALASYEADPTTQDTARELRKRLEELERTKWDTATASLLLDSFREASALRADVVRMQESGSSPELRDFLSAVRGPDGAPFSRMTDSLRAELETRNLLDRIRLRLR